MIFLALGLLLFLGAHIAISQRGFRVRMIAKWSEGRWRILVSLVSLLGLGLIAYGFGVYRAQGYIPLYEPPLALRHLALLLNLPIFILISAAYFPGHIKAAVKHPMLLAIKMWATAHLFANGDLGSILLFGSILIWGIYSRISVKSRELLEPRAAITGPLKNDLIAIIIGLVAYLFVLKYLHFAVIGVEPL